MRPILVLAALVCCLARGVAGEGDARQPERRRGPRHGPDAAQAEEAERHNASRPRGPGKAASATGSARPARPFAEYEPVQWLLMEGSFWFGSLPAKRRMLAQLPQGVRAVVYHEGGADVDRLARRFRRQIRRGKLVLLPLGAPRGHGFWSRDALPVPVWHEDGASPVAALVDARYYHRFEEDARFAESFGAELLAHDFYFEGGNFAADASGNAYVVDNDRVKRIPDEVFLETYGCASVTRLPWVHGIGHADEVVKVVADGVAVTDSAAVEQALAARGLDVRRLPASWNRENVARTGDSRYRSYANAVQVNGTMFVPAFGTPADREAQAVYASLGFRVVPIRCRRIADRGLGAIHCITMTWPRMPAEPADQRGESP